MEPGVKRDLAHSKIEISKKFARPLEPIARDVINKFNTGDLFELLAQVRWINANGGCHFPQRNLLSHVFINESPRFPDVPRLGMVVIVRNMPESDLRISHCRHA